MREFKSFRGFAQHLRRLQVELPAVVGQIGEQAGELVEARAKDSIGHYQAGAGPFMQWASLQPATEAHKDAMGYPLNAPLLATGDMRDSISHTVVRRMLGTTVEVGSTDEKMVYHEFGTSKLPPRPVLGPAMFGARQNVERIAAAAMFAYLAGRSWKKGK